MGKKVYRNIAVSCKAKDLLDEIAKAYAISKGAFVEKLIAKAHREMFNEEEN